MTETTHNPLSNISPYELLAQLELSEPPFDPFSIAANLGIEVDNKLSFEKMGLSGSITNDRGNIKIWVNPLDPTPRQRFTLAHELGHYINDILPNGKIEINDTPDTLYRSGASDPCETRANNFAGMLLMPKDAILAEASALIENSPSNSMSAESLVHLLAEKFEVSKAAMLVRLKKLRVISQDFYI